MRLVDTAVQEEGVELARQRPVWFVAIVVLSALMKLGFMLFAYLLVAPIGRRIPRFLYLLFGWGVGTGTLAYGLMYTLLGIRHTWGQEITSKGLWHLLVWWPQFWVAGALTIAATVSFQRTTRRLSGTR